MLKLSDFNNFIPETEIASRTSTKTKQRKRLILKVDITKGILYYNLEHSGDKVEIFGVNLERAIERYNEV